MGGYDYVGSLTQAGRLLSIDTPLGRDVLLLERMQGQETLCDLFDFRLHVRSKRWDIAPDEVVGLPLSWTLELPGGTRRSWSGVVGAIEAGHAVGDGMRAYTVTAKPWLWLFSHTSDCRIFQHQTTQQILETIFGEAGIRDYDFGAVTGPKEPRGYCVQYNETDLNFVFRLLEEEGWCWWFRHEAGQDGGAGRHVLVVADNPRAFAPGEEPRLRYTTTNVDLNDVTVWTRRWAFKPGAVAESDWNFETPRQDLTRAQPTVNPIKTSKPFEMYRWGGRFLEKGRADHITRRRMEVHEAAFDTIAADSGNRRIAPGQGFTLYGHPIAAENGDYTVISVDHEAKDPTYAPDAGIEGPSYANRFAAMPANKPFVPEQKTPHPKIEGVQTATVVGPPGEEIWIDQYGRIQVAFHWDRYARKRDGDSCWIQVCHAVSGGNHGLQVKPRIGMTAFITYVDGDPDKPLCIGTAPNPDNMVSYAFPDNKTRSTWRSLSHKAQGYVGNNEISMEDDTGRENLFLHAQKDHTLKVRNNHVKRVDNDKVESIGASKAINVAANHKEEIGGSMNLTVGGAGGGAPSLLSNVAGLAGSSAGLIAQATSIAQRGGAFSGGGGGSGGGDGSGLAGSLAAGALSATPALMQSFAGLIGGSALGFLAGPALNALSGLVAGPSTRQDAGAALQASGTGLGTAVNQLFSLPGMKNTVVGSFQADTIGVGRHEQVGVAKTVNVGQAYVVKVGTELRTKVGETVDLVSGEKIVHRTKQHFTAAKEKILLSAPGGSIEINETGIVIKGLKVEIKGNSIDFSSGGPGKGTDLAFSEECPAQKAKP